MPVDIQDLGRNMMGQVDELARENPVLANKLRETAQQTYTNLVNRPLSMRAGDITEPLSIINTMRKTAGASGYGGDSSGIINQKVAQILNRILRGKVVEGVPAAKWALPVASKLIGAENFVQKLPWPLVAMTMGGTRWGLPALRLGGDILGNPITRSLILQRILGQEPEASDTLDY